MYKVLFVCSGNTCRSPLAEAMLRKAIEEDADLKGKVAVSSAGTSTHFEDIVQYKAVEAGAKYGVDLNGYKSRQFAPELLDMFDIVIGMSKGHRDIINAHFPETADKVVALYEYITDEKDCKDVKDPFGSDQETYDKIAKEIHDLVDLMLPKLKQSV